MSLPCPFHSGGRMRNLFPIFVRAIVWLGALGTIGIACGSTDSTTDQQGAHDAGAGASGASPAGAGGASSTGAGGSSSETGGSSGSSTGSGGSSATGGSTGSGGGSAGSSGAGGAGGHGGSPTVPPADAPRECGTQTCAADEWCQYPCCGTLPMCMAMPGLDGGACPLGFQTCFTIQSGVRGCQDSCTLPMCTKQRLSIPGCTIMGRQVRCMCA
jgi:hypothetical protein